MTDYSAPVSSSDDPDVVQRKIAYAAQNGGGGSSLTPTGVAPGSYTLTNLTVNEFGQITAAISGTAPSGGSSNVWIGASEMIPRVTSGCGVNSSETTTNDVNYDTLDFDPGTQEGAQFGIVLPNNWNSGTITAKFYWTADSGSGDVVWSMAARSLGDGDAIDQAFGTAQSVTDTLVASALNISSATSSVTVAGTPANGKLVEFQVLRVAASGSDTLATDARLLGVEISYTAS